MSEQPFPPPRSGASRSAGGDSPEPTGSGAAVVRNGAGPAAGYGSPGPGPSWSAPGAAPAGYPQQPGGAPGHPGPGAPYGTAPQYSTQPVAVRRPDPLAALLLLLAGIAAGVSLLLTWLPGSDLTGWELTRRGLSTLGHSVSQIVREGWWQPLAVVLGGGVLFLLSLLMLVPARSHRFLGLLAVLISIGAGAGVLVPLQQAQWAFERFAVGFWFACAVAVLGFLGGLKALFTGPRHRAEPAQFTSAP